MGRSLTVLALAVGLLAGPTALGQEVFGPEAGDWEFTLAGGGVNDRRFEAGGFNLGGSLGYFVTDALLFSIRQDVGWASRRTVVTDPITMESETTGGWFGRSRAAADWHFDLDRLRPHVGASIGAAYDEDSCVGVAGLGGGLKYYLLPKTFVFGRGEYLFNFSSSGEQFRHGHFLWSVGLGLNF